MCRHAKGRVPAGDIRKGKFSLQTKRRCRVNRKKTFPNPEALLEVLEATGRGRRQGLPPYLLRGAALVVLLRAGLSLGAAFRVVTPGSVARPQSAAEQGRRLLRRTGWTVESIPAEAALRFLAEWLDLPSPPHAEETTR
jgi:hypothetical protein